MSSPKAPKGDESYARRLQAEFAGTPGNFRDRRGYDPMDVDGEVPGQSKNGVDMVVDKGEAQLFYDDCDDDDLE